MINPQKKLKNPEIDRTITENPVPECKASKGRTKMTPPIIPFVIATMAVTPIIAIVFIVYVEVYNG